MNLNKIEVMFTEEEVNERIRALGEQISRDYEGREVHLICILRGAVFFMCELAKRITVPVTFSRARISLLLRTSSIQAGRCTSCRSCSAPARPLLSASALCWTNPPAAPRRSTLRLTISDSRCRMPSWWDGEWILIRDTGTCLISA